MDRSMGQEEDYIKNINQQLRQNIFQGPDLSGCL